MGMIERDELRTIIRDALVKAALHGWSMGEITEHLVREIEAFYR